MFDHSNSFFSGGFFAGGFMWFFWLLFVVLIFVIIRALTGNDEKRTERGNESPLTILKNRYAKGEINEIEYDKLRKNLEE